MKLSQLLKDTLNSITSNNLKTIREVVNETPLPKSLPLKEEDKVYWTRFLSGLVGGVYHHQFAKVGNFEDLLGLGIETPELSP